MGATPDVKLLVGIDQAASGSLIDGDIAKLQERIDKKSFKAKIEIKPASITKLQSDISAAVKTAVDAAGNKNITLKVTKIDTTSAMSQFKADLQRVVNSVSLQSGQSLLIDAPQMGTFVAEAKKAATATSAISSEMTKLQARLSTLKKEASTMDTSFAKVTTSAATADIDTLRNKLVEAKAAFTNYENAVSNGTATDAQYQEVVKLNNEYSAMARNILDVAAAEKKKASAAAKSTAETALLEKGTKAYNDAISQTSNLLARVESAKNNWTSAKGGKSSSDYAKLEGYVSDLNKLITAIKTGELKVEEFRNRLSSLSADFNTSARTVKSFNENTQSAFGKLGSKLGALSTYMSASYILMRTIQSIKNMINASIELDDAMTQLQIVTRATNEEYEKFGDNIVSTAEKIGASVSDLIDSTTVYARLGYSLSESEGLAQYTSMLSNVGDIDVSVAQDAITAITKAYGIGADEIESYMDKMVVAGNNFPISVSQIAEGMNNAASALSSAGNSFEESVGLLTAANTVVQDISKASTGLRTITARLRSTTVELDELGEAMTEAEYEELVQALTDCNVSLKDQNGEFRSTYDIMSDIAAQWDKLTSMEQAAIANAAAGNRQQTVFFSIIEQFQTSAADAVAAMSDSEGSLQTAYDEYMESTTAHLGVLKSTMQELAAELFTQDFLNSFVDNGTRILEIIIKISEAVTKLGGLSTVIKEIIGIVAIKNIKGIAAFFKTSLASIKSYIAGFRDLADAFKIAKASGTGVAGAFDLIRSSAAATSAVISIAVIAFTAISTAIARANAKAKEMREELISIADNTSSEAQSIVELKKEYEDAYWAYIDGSGAKETLESCTESLIDKLREEGFIVGNLTDEYIALHSALQQITRDGLFDAQNDLMAGATAVSEEAISELKNKLTAMYNNAVSIRGISDTGLGILSDAGLDIFSDSQNRQFIALDNMNSWDDIISNYNILLDLIDRYNQKRDSGKITANELKDDQFYQSLLERKNVLEGYVTQYQGYIDEYNSLGAQIAAIDYTDKNGVPATVSEFSDMMNELYNASYFIGDSGSDSVVNAISSYMRNTYSALASEYDKQRDNVAEHIADTITLLNGETAESVSEFINGLSDIEYTMFSDWVEEYLASENNLSAGIEAMKSAFAEYLDEINQVDDNTDIIDNASKCYDDLEKSVDNTIDTFKDANKILYNNTSISEDLYKAISELVGGEEALASCVDTTNGYIVTNADAFNDLVDSARKAVASNISLAESNAKIKYHDLTSQLCDLVNGVDDYDASLRNNISNVLSNIDAVKDEITQYRLLALRLSGATKAYEELEAAQDRDKEKDYTDDLVNLLDVLYTSYEERSFGTEAFDVAFEGLIPEDVYSDLTDVGDQIDAGWEYINTKLRKYFSVDEDSGDISIDYDNIRAFVEDNLGGAFIGSLDSYELSDDIKSLEDFAKACGITEEAAMALGLAIEKYDITNGSFIDDIMPHTLENDIYTADQNIVNALEKQIELNDEAASSGDGWAVLANEIYNNKQALVGYADEARNNIQQIMELDSQISDAQTNADTLFSELQEMDESDPNFGLKYDEWVSAETTVAELLKQKSEIEEPTEMTIHLAAEGIQAEIDYLKSTIYQDDGVHIKTDVDQATVTETQNKISELQAELDNVNAYIEADDDSVMTALENVQEYTIENKTFRVSANTSAALAYLHSLVNYLSYVTGTKWRVNVGASSSFGNFYAGGTANAYGTAHESGSFGLTGKEHNSLVGELGEELVCIPSQGRYYTVGTNGAELVDIPAGAIIFNHKQTEGLLKNKRINSRGRAYASGSAHFGLSNKTYDRISGNSTTYYATTTNTVSSSTASSSSVGSSAESEEDSWFERMYKYHQHLVSMEQETDEQYFNWLRDAYQKAYNEGIIELEDYYSYQEECFELTKSLFEDYVNDIEHYNSMLEHFSGNEQQIIANYKSIMSSLEEQIKAAYSRGLDNNSEYVQELQEQWFDARDAITEIQDELYENAKSAVEDLIDFRIDMIKQDLENQKDAINDELDALKDFYDKQRDMLEEQYDEEDYLREQAEKRKSVTDIQSELNALQFDNSAWAAKRRLELQDELSSAKSDLDDFERDRAREEAAALLDAQQEEQEAAIELRMQAIEDALNNPKAIYDQALSDIRGLDQQMYDAMLDFNSKYGSGRDEDVSKLVDAAYKATEMVCQTYKDVSVGNLAQADVESVGDKSAAGEAASQGSWETSSVNTDVIASSVKSDDKSSSGTSSSSTSSTSSSSKSYPYGKASDTSGNIGQGSRGTSVKAIQYALNQLGFGNSGTSSVDGIFGSGTAKAVRSFQGTYGLTRDGIVGVKTRNKFSILGYESGTDYATPGIHEIDEAGSEYLFTSSDGSRYRVLNAGDKVLNATASTFLYDFATGGKQFLYNMIRGMFPSGSLSGIHGSETSLEVTMGDININGNASQQTVSEIRRAQRDNVDYMLRQLKKLNT